MKSLFIALLSIFAALTFHAQCEGDLVEVQLSIFTDAYGYELFWELNYSDQECGEMPIDFGGNLAQVDCTGGLFPIGEINGEDPNALENNEEYTYTYCLDPTSILVLHHRDGYNDGGTNFAVAIDGVQLYEFNGQGEGNSWEIDLNSTIGSQLNDAVCDALEIELDGATVVGDNVNGTAEADEVQPLLGGCGTPGQWCGSDGGASVSSWAHFTLAEPGAVRISTCEAGTFFDSQLALYSATDCSDFGTFELLGANDDQNDGCGLAPVNFTSVLYAECLEAGVDYYIQIDGWQGATGLFELSLSTANAESSLSIETEENECGSVDPSGSVVANVSPNSTSWVVEIEDENGQVFVGNQLGGLSGGFYIATATNSCSGDSFTETVTVVQSNNFAVGLVEQNPSCSTPEGGFAAVKVSTSSGEYDVLWSDFEGNELGEADFLEGLPAGIYQVAVEDGFGCEYETQFTLVFEDNLELDLGENQTICQDEVLFFTLPLGFTYNWQDGSQNQYFQFFADEFGVGTHEINGTATNGGCEGSASVEITVDACLEVSNLEETGFKFYPNPNQGKFTIERGSTVQSIAVLNMATGQVVLEKELNPSLQTEQIAVEAAPGVYVLQMQTKSGQIHHNIMILNH